MRKLILAVVATGLWSTAEGQLHFEGKEGVGKGKKIVFLTGDEEYRGEESGPMFAKILSQRFGYDCTVLFSMDSEGKYIDPNNQRSMPGIEELKDADLMIIGTRFRRLDDGSYQILADYLNEGKPVIGFRTSTHAFTGDGETEGFKWKTFGPRIIGDGWVSHHGKHKVEGARGVIEKANEGHAILNGVSDVFGPSDVYGIRAVKPDNSTILLRGEVTDGLTPDSKAVEGEKNKPMQPLAWLREYTAPNGSTKGLTFATTMGASVDFLSEDLRRLMVNAALFLTDEKVPAEADVTPVDAFNPTFYGFIKQKGFFAKRNLQVDDFKLGSSASTGLPDGMIPAGWTVSKGDEQASAQETTLPFGEVKDGERLVFVGGGLGDGMQRHPHFEAYLQTAFPGKKLVVRNLCHPGFTAGFRPHPSRKSQWAFPGADKIRPEFSIHKGTGHYPTEDEWLTTLKADTVLGFFGWSESFDGKSGLDAFQAELNAWIDHSRSQKYNGQAAPKLVLISPIAPETWVEDYETRVADLTDYVAVMAQVAAEKKVGFVNLFEMTQQSAELGGSTVKTPYGVVPGDEGYRWLGRELVKALFNAKGFEAPQLEKVYAAVEAKNWHWMNDYRMPNGVHVYGRRYKPFGPDNYPDEIKKNREMTENRDQAIWAAAEGRAFDLAAADAKTTELKPVDTNYKPSVKNGSTEYKYGQDAIDSLEVADGFQIELFASEREFDNLANPVQMAFDNKGRLWVATMPSYPHYRPGDAYPDDKILIYEDTDGDGKADKETVFVDKISLPMGFELSEYGVFVSQAPHLVLMRDTDGDDKCDTQEIVMTGFDHHDTHHAVSAFCADPSGAFMLSEGVFLHSNTETMRGAVRGVDGGFYRYSPRLKRLERTVQVSIPNPWGVAFDEWGQDFFLHTSGTKVNWMLPVSMKTPYGVKNPGTHDLIPESHRVRPTSGLEFVSSRHFPEEMHGDMLLCNNIGFLGIKQHSVKEDGTGYKLEHRQDLVVSKDGNFRPVDLEFAPDGSLYLVDWHNVLIGHMQHNARDPYRDHAHGRIYRITAKDRPLVKSAPVAGASVSQLLENLKEPEYRARYRTRRELRGHDADEVAAATKAWVAKQTDEHARLEALWVGWGIGRLDEDLLKSLLQSEDHRVRAAAVRVLRYNYEFVSGSEDLLLTAASDSHGRVRMEAAVTASWMDNAAGLEIATAAAEGAKDMWNEKPIETSLDRLKGIEHGGDEEAKAVIPKHLAKKFRNAYRTGHEIYHREGFCITCHQEDGNGLPSAGFPPLAGTKWVNDDKEALIKLTLNGLMGPIEVKGVKYPGQVPMTPFGGMLKDEEVAAVLTYVRNSFGNKSEPVTPAEVKEVREKTKDKVGFYSPEELLKK
ncbi:PVC-type heme-binding CxxCH protein [Roseibacillus persicicus]|nr:PVC-type heme-binding CxxCH protein [Roseibacillus persicicus]